MAKTKWQAHLMETYQKLKKKDKTVTFTDAMKAAAKTFEK